jgi:transcriptional regulator NrdR family protein
MKCPKCGSEDLFVIETREVPENPKALDRKRQCRRCGQRFFSEEEIKHLLPPTRPYAKQITK